MYIKRADIADTLGLTSVLLVDKSALLAPNQMRLKNFWLNRQLLTVDNNSLSNDEEMANKQTLNEILDTISVCNRTPNACFEEPIEETKCEKKRVCETFLKSKNEFPIFRHYVSILSKSTINNRRFKPKIRFLLILCKRVNKQLTSVVLNLTFFLNFRPR